LENLGQKRFGRRFIKAASRVAIATLLWVVRFFLFLRVLQDWLDW
jgi:hypothetical protein